MNKIEKAEMAIAKFSDTANSLAKLVGSLPKGLLNSKEDFREIGNLGATLWGLYNESKRIDNENLVIKGHLKKMAYQFQNTQLVLENIFSERREVMRKHFEVIDHALKTNNDELILRALKQVSETISNSPFENLEKFKSVLDNSNETLHLDF